MRRPRTALGILLALATALLLVVLGRSSMRGPAADGVRVREIAAQDAEPGEPIVVLGDGFPVGEPARVSLRGTLFRPGTRAETGAHVELEGVAVSSDRVEVAFSDREQAMLCGDGARAAHTTFEGDLEVAFPSPNPGAPPPAGTLGRVLLDVRPANDASAAARERQGRRVLDWAGATAVATGPGGLVVQAVAARSRAEAAGILAGDVIERFDGVRVESPGDLAPAPGERAAVVAVRGGKGAGTLRLDLDGFWTAPATGLPAAAVWVLTALAAVGLFAAPTHPALAAAAQRWALRAVALCGDVDGVDGGTPEARPPRSGGRRALVPRVADVPTVAALAAYALVALAPFGQYAVVARLDVAAVFAVAATTATAAAFAHALVTAWLRPGVTRPAWGASIGPGLRVLWRHVPSAAAVACAVIASGSVRMQEISRSQGGSPWRWLAFRNPAALVAIGLLLSCAWLEADATSTRRAADGRASARSPVAPRIVDLVERAPGGCPTPGGWLQAVGRAHRVVMAGLASVAFLGGWSIPGVPAGVQDAAPTLELAGAACLLAKTWGLVRAASWVRGHIGGAGPAATTTVAALCVALTAAWTAWCPPPAAQLSFSALLFAGAILSGAALLHRMRHALRSQGTTARLSPFL